jgi:hypothetical protein
MARVLILAVLVLAAGSATTGRGAVATARCGTISAGGARYAVRVEHGAVACATARRVLRRFIATTRRPTGWACFRGHRGQRWAAACARGNRIVRAYPR